MPLSERSMAMKPEEKGSVITNPKIVILSFRSGLLEGKGRRGERDSRNRKIG